MNYTLYRTDTGAIFQSGWGEPPTIEGMAYVEGQYDASEWFVSSEGEVRPLPPKPSDTAVWDREEEVWSQPGGPSVVEQAREASSSTRLEFCKRALELGVLTPDGAKQFTKGEIPDQYLPLLTGMSNFDMDMMEIELAGSTRIDRNNPFILYIAQKAGFSDELVDQLFGVEIDE